MILYLFGDVTKPNLPGKKILIHCCNDSDGFGSGVAGAIAKRWPMAKAMYHNWARGYAENGGEGDDWKIVTPKIFRLGETQFVQVEDDIYVANMIGQRGYGYKAGERPPIRYEAIEECLKQVQRFATRVGAVVIAPRFGSGLAGGSWAIIEGLINQTLTHDGGMVYIYDLPGATWNP